MSEQFWENRWVENNIGWDLGEVSRPIKEYIDQLSDKSIKILIPGCGNAYEAEYLIDNGFTNIYVVEISGSAIASFKTRCPQFPVSQIIHSDFFEIEGQYDLILEQTFFCALDPSYSENYVERMTKLLKTDGKLIGQATHSEFATYVTAIGLYNDENELLAIGKIAKPVKNEKEMALSFVVRFDTN